MDWLAGSRLHLVDTIVTGLIPCLPPQRRARSGPTSSSCRSTRFIHANVRFRLGAIEPLVTPRYHHRHHASAPEARDRNFAVHLPVLDRLFGTRYLPPGAWPAEYGLGDGRNFPESWLGQTVAPFKRRL
jgi:lathosterol oxidase